MSIGFGEFFFFPFLSFLFSSPILLRLQNESYNFFGQIIIQKQSDVGSLTKFSQLKQQNHSDDKGVTFISKSAAFIQKHYYYLFFFFLLKFCHGFFAAICKRYKLLDVLVGSNNAHITGPQQKVGCRTSPHPLGLGSVRTCVSLKRARAMGRCLSY